MSKQNKCTPIAPTDNRSKDNSTKVALITAFLTNIVSLIIVLITVIYQVHTLKIQLDRTQKAVSHEILLHKQVEMALEFSPILERLLYSTSAASLYIETEMKHSPTKEISTSARYEELLSPIRADIELLRLASDKYSIIMPSSLKISLMFSGLCETMLLQSPKGFPEYFYKIQTALRDSIGVDQLGNEYMDLVNKNAKKQSNQQNTTKN